jgi:Cu-Zn family superoxide dismutase
VLEHSDRVQGTVLFKQEPDSPTLIVGRITGLRPGLHGFHVHEFGDLSRGCESAGQHYNPDEVDHGDIDSGHVGDLGNIIADAEGIAEFSIVAERVDLMGDRSVVGRAIVVHENQDDLGQGGDAESLKTGNAGDRLACGVITLKQTVTEAARVPRKPGQPANSKKHSDLYTDENPRGTIHGLKFATPEDARASVSKIRSSGRSHAHKIQAAVAMEQRARVAGKSTAAAVYRKFINAMKKKTTQEQQLAELQFRGSECTQDCSGHRAGHEWYGRNGRTPVTLSPSFNKGAAIAAAGR